MLPHAHAAESDRGRHCGRQSSSVLRRSFHTEIRSRLHSSGLQRGHLRRSARARGHRDRLFWIPCEQLPAGGIPSRRRETRRRCFAGFSRFRPVLQWICAASRRKTSRRTSGWRRCSDRGASKRTKVDQEKEGLFRGGTPENYVSWIERRGRGIFLEACPIDVSGMLREYLFSRVPTCVLTSATLTVGQSFEYI